MKEVFFLTIGKTILSLKKKKKYIYIAYSTMDYAAHSDTEKSSL